MRVGCILIIFQYRPILIHLFKSSRRKLSIDVAQRSILKKKKENIYYPRLICIPKTGQHSWIRSLLQCSRYWVSVLAARLKSPINYFKNWLWVDILPRPQRFTTALLIGTLYERAMQATIISHTINKRLFKICYCWPDIFSKRRVRLI